MREKRNLEDMFNDFDSLSRFVKNLGGVVQNEGVEYDEEGLLEWSNNVNEAINKLSMLREDVIRYFQD